MAITTKKKRKTSKVKKTKESTQIQEDVPTSTEELVEEAQPPQEAITEPLPYDPNIINVPFSKDELANIVNLMGISAKTFEALALAAAEQGENAKFMTLSARYQMISNFGTKLQLVLQIGEPVSQQVH